MSTWIDEETPVSELTITALDKMVEEMQTQREICGVQKDVLAVENEKLQLMESRILTTLKELGRDNFPSKHGTVATVHKTSYKLPKTPEEKAAYFKYLQDRGVYDSMVSVNSQTHNSFCKEEFEVAKASGKELEFSIPGIGEASIFETLSFRKSKS